MERDRCPKLPLIFVAHSLGGILVKQALVNAGANDRFHPIRDATRALLFFRTPHGGGNDALVTLGSAAARILNFVTSSVSNDILTAVKKGSLYSDVLQEGFRHQLERYDIVSFVEGRGQMRGRVIIVDRDSATFGLPGTRENIVDLKRNHSDICQFNFDNLEDIASYKIVQHNMRTAYNKIIESEDLMERLGGLNTPISAPSSSGQAALGPGR